MIELLFEEKIFRIDQNELSKIGREAEKELLEKEREQGIIHTQGFYAAADRLRVPSCFACGSFEDYSGNCRYKSKIKATINGITKGICKREDAGLVYAIENGKLNKYEIKGGK